MRKQWCWKCKAEVPMLDEAEHAAVTSAIRHMKETSRLNERAARAAGTERDRVGILALVSAADPAAK